MHRGGSPRPPCCGPRRCLSRRQTTPGHQGRNHEDTAFNCWLLSQVTLLLAKSSHQSSRGSRQLAHASSTSRRGRLGRRAHGRLTNLLDLLGVMAGETCKPPVSVEKGLSHATDWLYSILKVEKWSKRAPEVVFVDATSQGYFFFQLRDAALLYRPSLYGCHWREPRQA